MLILRQPRIFDVDLLGPVIAGVIVLAMWLGIIRPLEARISGERSERQAIDQQKTDAQAQLDLMRQRGETLGVLATVVQNHQEIIRRHPGEDQVIARWDDMLAKSHLQWNALVPTGYYVHPCFYRWDAQLNLTGSSTALTAFLNDLALEMPYCKTRSLSIISQNDPTSCSITLNMDVFAPPRGGY